MGFCEYGYEPSGFPEDGEFLEQLTDYGGRGSEVG
jgi:hypothetical protein